MANESSTKTVKLWDRFIGGVSDFPHENLVPDAYYSGISVDVRTEPRHVSILPRTLKESGTVVTDLIKWADVYQTDLSTYMYGDSGNIYKRTSARSYSLLRTVPNSHGNGLSYNPEDDFFYYTTDKAIGRYGNMTATTPTFNDDFLGSQGGVPLNTNSLDLESGSSQYGYRADTASLSITGDLSIVAQIKPESLPTVGNTMTLVSKWNGSGNIRSYKFDIACVSGYFGDGTDGALTISSNTTESPIDSACTGTSGTTSLTATNASFAIDQIVLIHQTRGTGAGTWQRNTIAGYTAGIITLGNALNADYVSGAQVRVLKKYTNVTIDSGKTYTAKAWNGTVGGILAFLASGTVTVTGTISANGSSGVQANYSSDCTGGGFYGARESYAGEGTAGAVTNQSSANGSGGGGGDASSSGGVGGGGGANGTAGTNGSTTGSGGTTGKGGNIVGSSDLTTMDLGAGGGGGDSDGQDHGGQGGSGGGIIFITGATITITGSITANGGSGGEGGGALGMRGGGGSGGSILLKGQVVTLGALLITANGGSGGGSGGNGGEGRIHLDYYTSYTGTTSPTLDVTQDNNLVTSTTYQLRLAVSSNGTAYETLAKEASILTANWQQVGVSWDASASQATFILNSVSVGTATGAITAISDNSSEFFVGANKNDAGTAANFYDGLVDEVKVFSGTRTTDQFQIDSLSQTPVNESGLVFYGKFNGDLNDATANANNLTGSGTPTYSTDVPFPSPTTRQDLDQSATTTGNTYALATTISESAANRKTFTPAKDPQKSVEVSISAVGTGNWTVTVHDTLNNEVASVTVPNASLHTGYYEFTFGSVWRPLTNFTNEYHFHITSTVADGTVLTTTSNDLETVSYRTYFQFLVEDTAWHPITKFLNFIVFGNERYVGKYEATLYEPNKLVFGAGWRARCFGYWQEYLAIGCMRGTNIYDFDQGRVYFWDGYSPTFNFYIDVPEGGVNALLGTRGQLYIWAGYHADLLTYQGGTTANKLKEVPLLAEGSYAEVYPGAVAMWRANPRYGLAGASDSADIKRAVYTWGSTNSKYVDVLTCDYPISTGNYGNTVNIGMIYPLNQELLISWKDNVSYGVDYENVDNPPYPTASIEMMVEDSDIPYKEKEALQLTATFDPLLTGESINVKHMNEENDTAWVTNADSPAVGDITIRQVITNGRYYHMKVAVDLTAGSGTAPTLKSLALTTNNLESEDVVG